MRREAVKERNGRCEGRKPYGAIEGEPEVVALIKSLHRKPKGKKRMRQVGNVEVPQTAFLAVLKLD